MSVTLNLDRTLIVGNAGSGKSWLAGRLSARLDIRATSLDRIHWRDGGYDAPRLQRDAIALTREAASVERWLIEGVYGWLLSEAVPRATALIWLDLSCSECVANLHSRGPGADSDAKRFAELLTWAAAYDARTSSTSRAGHDALFREFGGTSLRLRSRVEIGAFLSSLTG